MARVVMFVMNAVSFDSRVLREAATLAGAGHSVTILGTDGPAGLPVREHRDGFNIVRVARPTAWRDRWRNTVVKPWAGRRLAGHRVIDGIRGLRPGLIAMGSARVLASVAISAIRRAWLAIPRRPATKEREWPPETVTLLVTWRWGILGWARAAADAAPPADVYHGHDLTGLPAAVMAAARNGGRVVYDSHEIFVESGRYATRPRWAKLIFRRLERQWASAAAALVTVNHAYANVLTKRLRPKRVIVVHNCPTRTMPAGDAPDRLRAAAGISAQTPVVLYHGAFAAHRGMEQLAASIAALGTPAAHVVFLGYGARRAALDELAVAEPEGRIHVLDAVPPSELLDWVRTADVDAIPLQRSTLNHVLCTPNKLFESLAVGVPVVVSDFPVMRRIVMDDPLGPLGAVCDPDDPASIAAAIRSVIGAPPEERRVLRERCLRAAHERWNWETEGSRLLALYADLTVPATS